MAANIGHWRQTATPKWHAVNVPPAALRVLPVAAIDGVDSVSTTSMRVRQRDRASRTASATDFPLATAFGVLLLIAPQDMAAIGRFQKGDEIFYAKVVDGQLFRLHGDVFGSPSFDKKATPFKGLRNLTPVSPSKVIAVGLNYAD